MVMLARTRRQSLPRQCAAGSPCSGSWSRRSSCAQECRTLTYQCAALMEPTICIYQPFAVIADPTERGQAG